ncbi:restriction endonuclease subunit S [Lactococcus petauri]|uniref:restriction endonuclease subunit S n=1 Tax=Lactococcus petauri TaxID=1940789 RepID=UPI0022E56FD3|nr:restriction endonuclease subunit S [Lactococcus petauri]
MAKIDDSVKKKVPELRFKGFTDDWEERKLSDIADRFDNLRVPITASDRKSGDTPYYGANGIQDYVEGFTHDGEFILVAEDGANDLKNYPVQYVNGKVWVNNHAHVLQGKNTITDNKFLMNSIKNFNIEPFLVGGGRAKLNADVMMKLNILLPTFDEQEKIGSFFSLLDDTIALHQRKLDLLKEQKKGFLYGAKVPELRFAGFADDWEQRKLGEVTEKIGSGKTPKGGNSNYQSHGVALIRSQNIFDDRVNNNDIAYISDKVDNDMKNSRVFKNDVLLNITGASIGRSAVYQSSDTANVNQHVCIIRPKDNIVSNFIQLNISSTKGQKEIELNQAGGGREGLNFQQIAKMIFSYPSYDEQQVIGLFFEKINDTITLHQRKLDLLKEQKKGFLQKMFV